MKQNNHRFLFGLSVLLLALSFGITGCSEGSTEDPTLTVTIFAKRYTTSVAKGGTLQFFAAVAGTNNPAQTVTWSITTANIAAGTSINPSGLLTVAAGESKTSIEVKATSTADTAKSGTKTIEIVDWERLNSPISGSINGVAYGDGKWVAVGNYGEIATSPDGITWTQVTNSSFGSFNIRGVAYGDGTWVAVGGRDQIATSPDGITWTQVTNSSFSYSPDNGYPPNYGYICGVAYGDGKWVAVGGSGKMATSANGTTWTQVTNNPFGSAINCVAYGDGTWVVGGDFGQIAYSK